MYTSILAYVFTKIYIVFIFLQKKTKPTPQAPDKVAINTVVIGFIGL